MAEEKISNITKLKIECNNCNTNIILDFDDTNNKGIYKCPRCNKNFDIDDYNDIYTNLSELIQSVKSNKKATFSLICEEK